MELIVIGRFIMATLYILAGLNHFLQPKLYLRMIPPALSMPRLLNYGSGALEIIFGIALLFPATQTLAAWGIILLLVAVFPANIYMLTSQRFKKIPNWVLWVRLPLQFLLIWWAYLYT